MSYHCPRCGASLLPIEEASPAYCAHCGLRQLRVSSDALASAAEEYGQETPGGDLAGQDALILPRALRIVALAGLLGVVPACLLPGALVAGALGGLALLLIPALVLAVVFIYGRSSPLVLVSTAAGIRLGALLGSWMGCLIAATTGIAGFVLRYGYHSRAMDEKIEQAAAVMPAQLRAAGPPPPELLQFLQTPEFRAGTFIAGHVFTLLLLVAVGSICGWMAATMLRVRRQRSIG